MSMSLQEPARTTDVYGEYDVVVLGGGPAGIAAVTAASRGGRSALLVERYGFLGGMGTAAGVTNFCGLYANIHGKHVRVVEGIAAELLDRIDRYGGLNAPHVAMKRIQAQAYDTPAYKMAADDLILSSGAKVLFHALAVGVIKSERGDIRALLVETKSGRRAIVGRVFIDCSGDGDLAAWAGAPFETGDGDGNMLYPSTMFRINGVDYARVDHDWSAMGRLMDAEAERRGRQFPRKGPIIRPQKSKIEWRANVTQLAREDGNAISGIDAQDLSNGEIIGRKQVWEIFDFVRTVPGFESSYVVDVAPQIGIRETRRVRGAYMLTEQDVLGCADFSDTIGVNGWPLEIHARGDVYYEFAPSDSRGFNQLPYRMMLAQGVDNLLVAGRCASMTHLAQSAARVTGACFVMGQAAGTAASMAISSGVAAAELNMTKLQAQLRTDGAYLGDEIGGTSK